MRRGSIALAAAAFIAFAAAAAERGAALQLQFYTLPGCHDCEAYEEGPLKSLRARLEAAGLETSLAVRSVLDPDAFAALSALLAARGLPYGGTPILAAGDIVLHGAALQEEDAYERLTAAFGGGRAPAPPASAQAAAEKPFTVAAPSFWIVAGAGLADGVNPCAMTVLVFLVSALALSGRNRSAILPVGLGFAAGVFAAYLSAGFGLLGAAAAIARAPAGSAVLRWGTAAVLAALSVLSARDARLCAAGKAGKAALKLPAPFTAAAHALIRRGRRAAPAVGAAAFLGAALLGAAVSLVEFVCTGQIYLPTIVYIARTSPAAGTPLLLAYNLAFVAPLLAVFAFVFFGASHERLAAFSKRHLGAGKLIMSAVFALLAAAIALR